MVEEITLFAISVFLTGLVFTAIGGRNLINKEINPTIKFDLGLGAVFVLYGTIVGLIQIEDWLWLHSLSFTYFLTGMFIYRKYYLQVNQLDRRRRDLSNTLFIGVPGAVMLIEIVVAEAAVFAAFLIIGFGVVLAGGVWLLIDGIRFIRQKKVYVRDVVASIVMISFLIFHFFAIAAAFAGMPP